MNAAAGCLRQPWSDPIFPPKQIHFGAGSMPVNLSIKNAPDDLVALLKARAERNHRSMQGEALAILEAAVCTPPRLTPDEVLAKARQLGLNTRPTSASIIRSDRDRR
jgi:plasmid stability protein